MINFPLLNYVMFIHVLSCPLFPYQEYFYHLLISLKKISEETWISSEKNDPLRNKKEEPGADPKVLEGYVSYSPQGYVRLSAGYASQIVVYSPHPLPRTGQTVKKGQIIACLEGIIPKADEAARRKELHDVEADIKKLSAKVKRLKKLDGFSPRVELENTLIDLTKAQRQREVLLDLFSIHCIQAPLEGIIKVDNIHPGQILKAEDLLAEIFSPQDFQIVAQIKDYSLKDNLTGVYVSFPGLDRKLYPLVFEGASPALESDKSQLLIFSPVSAPEGLIVGMPVNIYIPLREKNNLR